MSIKISILICLFVFVSYRGEAQVVKVVRNNPGFVEGIETVTEMIFSEDSKFAYSAGSSGLTVFNYNANNGKVRTIETIRPELLRSYLGNTSNSVSGIVISHDSNYLYATLSASEYILIFRRDINTGRLIFLDAPPLLDPRSVAFVGKRKLLISPDDQYVYINDVFKLQIFKRSISTGSLSLVNNEWIESEVISDILLTADGKHLYWVAFGNTKVMAFDRNSITGLVSPIQEYFLSPLGLNGIFSVAITPDESHIYLGTRIGLAQLDRNTATGLLSFSSRFIYPTPELLPFYSNGPVEVVSLIVNQQGNRLYASANAGGNFSSYAIEPLTGALTLLEKHPSNGYNLFLSGEGFLYELVRDHFLNCYQENIPNDLTKLEQIKIGLSLGNGLNAISAQAISADGGTLFFASSGDQCITSYNSGGQSQAILSLKWRLNYASVELETVSKIVATKDQKNLYVVNNGASDQSIVTFSLNGQQQFAKLSSLPFANRIVELETSINEKFLYVLTNDNLVHLLVRATDGTLTWMAQWSDFNGVGLDMVKDLVISPDDKILYLLSDKKIFILDKDNVSGTLSYLNLLNLPYANYGRQMIMRQGGNHVVVIASDLSGLTFKVFSRNSLNGNLVEIQNFSEYSVGVGEKEAFMSNDIMFVKTNSSINTVIFKFDDNGSLLPYGSFNLPGIIWWSAFNIPPEESYLFLPNGSLIYGVRKNGNGIWVYSYEDILPPLYPINLQAQAGNRSITLTWSARAYPNVRYALYSSEGALEQTISALKINEVTTTSYVHQNLSYKRNYWIKTIVNGKESIFSQMVSAVPFNLPPSIPSNVTAGAGDRFIRLNWDVNTETDFKIFRLFRNTIDLLGTAQLLFSGTASEFLDNSVLYNESYYYWVEAVDMENNVSSKSASVLSSPINLPPVAPQNIQLTSGDKFLLLRWSANTENDFKQYKLYRGTTNLPAGASLVTSTTSVSFKDEAVDYGQQYFYWLKAEDVEGKSSSWSVETIGIPTNLVPSRPTGLSIQLVLDHIKLSWNENPESDILEYEVWRNNNNDQINAQHIGKATSLNFTDDNPLISNNYYWIKAVDQANQQSDFSDPISVLITEISNDMPLGWLIYPNPVSEKMNIISPENEFDGELRIVDSLNRTLRSIKLSDTNLYVDDLASGVYTILVSTKKYRFTYRFIKI
ncbi:MAG: beta-propeller fold lactonase family protein [Cyclobacteriaceae bacterium]